MLVLRVRGRRAVGALLGLLGVGLVLVGVLRRAPSPTLVRQQVLDISLLDTVVLRSTVWPWVYAGAGALVLAGGVLTVLRSGRWPGRTDRFRRDAAPVNGRQPGRSRRPVEGHGRRSGPHDRAIGPADQERDTSGPFDARGPRCA